MSRAIGDVDSGPYILAYPAVKQLYLPKPPCRLIVASDGVWDALETPKACSCIRTAALAKAAHILCKTAVEQRRVHDDTSAIIVDFLSGPAEEPTVMPFKMVAKRFGRSAPRATVVLRRLAATGEVVPMDLSMLKSGGSFSSLGSSRASSSALSALDSPTGAPCLRPRKCLAFMPTTAASIVIYLRLVALLAAPLASCAT